MLNKYRDIAGVDMSYDEFKQSCRKAWWDDYNYLTIDKFKPLSCKYTIQNEFCDTYKR